MQYRPYGKTGIQVSALGFGAMRLPQLEDKTVDLERSVPMLRRGIDLGINYIDSAYGYINGTSEVAVGKAIKGYDRSKLHLATKIPVGSPEDGTAEVWRAKLETQLKRFDSPYIDFIHFHVGSWSWYVFNVADPAIVAGVVGLLYDGFVLERRRGREPQAGDIGQAATRSPE